jgi:hypothetical protein
MANITLNLVDIYDKKNGYYEYDFFPNRQYNGVEYVVLFHKESWGNIDYINKFIECDKNNIQLICFTSYNLFPICSYICHKCILVKDKLLFFDKNAKKSCYRFSLENFMKDYKVDKIFSLTDRATRRKINYKNQLYHAWDLFDLYKTAPIYIDKHAHNIFKNNNIFIQNQIIALYKHIHYGFVIDKLKSDGFIIDDFDSDIYNKILNISTSDYFLSFQVLSSLYSGVSWFAFGGAASVISLCLPINTVFVSDHYSNVPETMVAFKSFYNKYLYNIPTNGFFHIRFDCSYKLDGGWRYECLKESLNNTTQYISPIVKEIII